MISDSVGSRANINSALHGLRQSQQHESAAASALTQTQQTWQEPLAPEQQVAEPRQAVRKSEDGGDAGYQGHLGRGQNLDLEV